MAESMTVKEAARMLGASPDAIRKRVARGTLEAEKLPDGTVLVWVDATPDDVPDGGAPNGSHPTPAHLETLERYISRLEAELEAERNAHAETRRIAYTLAQRVPHAIEASETPHASETASEPTEREIHRRPLQRLRRAHRSRAAPGTCGGLASLPRAPSRGPLR